MNYVSQSSNSAFISSEKPKENLVSSKKAKAIEEFVSNHSFVVNSSKEANPIIVEAIKK